MECKWHVLITKTREEEVVEWKLWTEIGRESRRWIRDLKVQMDTGYRDKMQVEWLAMMIDDCLAAASTGSLEGE